MAEDGKNEANLEDALDLSGLGSFDFTPDWARGRSDDKSKYARFEAREERRADEGRGRLGGNAPRGRDDGGRRPPRRASPSDGERRRDPSGDRRGPRQPFGERRRGDGQGRPQRPFVKPLDVDVRILPSQKDLGTIIKQIQTTKLAYPLKQLVMFFLDHPEACILRLSPKEGADVHFHQCKACGHLAFSADELQAHVLSAHLSDYYDAEEVDCEPPKGSFSCVARCGMSGVLLGPPNLHGYDARIREVIRGKFPAMDESAFRARIEMVHDADVVEEWRKSVTKKTVYRRRPAKDAAKQEGDAPEAPALDREAAEREFRREIAPGLMSEPKTPDFTAEAALKTENLPLLFACRDALNRERRRPHDLSRALRGAFHHRKLVFFRANASDGQEFVCAVAPTPLDVAHAIPDLVELVKYVEEHPDQHRQAVVAALSGGDAKKASAVRQHLSWLVERGNLVNFSVGILSAPETHPRFRPPRRAAAPAEAKPQENAGKKAEEEAKPAEAAAPASETSAPEPSAPAPETPAPTAEAPALAPEAVPPPVAAEAPVAEVPAPAEAPAAEPAVETPVAETAGSSEPAAAEEKTAENA